MTKTSQDFTIYVGDQSLPTFQVLDSSGNPIPLTNISDIFWTAQRDLDSAAVISKSMSAGQIVRLNGGQDGRFAVTIDPADTQNLSGFYMHEAVILDDLGLRSTVSTGRLQVGRAPVWTYSGDPRTSQKDQIRYMVGDTIESDQQLTDGEILYAIQAAGGVNRFRIASDLCNALASKFARLVDTVDKDLRTMYSSKSRNYRQMALQYLQSADGAGGGVGWASGILTTQKRTQEANTNRVQPQFVLGMTDNYIPEAPVGNETQS